MAPHIDMPGAGTFDPLQAALLRLAICCGDVESVRRCLGAGADPNGCDAAGQSPLALAAALGQARVCEMLLAHGAEPPAETRPAASAVAPAWAEAPPQVAPEAFSDRAYRIAKALLAANPASESPRPPR